MHAFPRERAAEGSLVACLAAAGHLEIALLLVCMLGLHSLAISGLMEIRNILSGFKGSEWSFSRCSQASPVRTWAWRRGARETANSKQSRGTGAGEVVGVHGVRRVRAFPASPGVVDLQHRQAARVQVRPPAQCQPVRDQRYVPPD